MKSGNDETFLAIVLLLRFCSLVDERPSPDHPGQACCATDCSFSFPFSSTWRTSFPAAAADRCAAETPRAARAADTAAAETAPSAPAADRCAAKTDPAARAGDGCAAEA